MCWGRADGGLVVEAVDLISEGSGGLSLLLLDKIFVFLAIQPLLQFML